jgi:hypothetical protein
MSVGGVGSSTSFWQQDQNYWSHAEAEDQVTTADNALITAMGSVMTNEARGLASVATQQALDRTNAQLKAALQSALQTVQGGSSTSSASASTAGAPATGTGTIPLTLNTSLLTLGIPATGTITVSDGTNTTTYTSTGTDTVNDLIGALNTNAYGNAQVTAALNPSGDLVITGKNDSDPVIVGGLFASNVGFGNANDTFQPTAPSTPASASSSSSTSASSASSSTSGSSSSSGTAVSTTSGSSSSGGSSTASSLSPAALFNSSYALQTGSSAESLLSSNGLSGSLVNLLA